MAATVLTLALAFTSAVVPGTAIVPTPPPAEITRETEDTKGEDLLATGSAALNAERFTEAELVLSAAAERLREEGNIKAHGRALFSLGLARLELGDHTGAREALSEAELVLARPEDRAACRFNIAASLVRESDAPAADATSDPAAQPSASARLDVLRAAARAYRDVLRITPNDAEAARRVEYLRRMIQQAEQQQQQMQDQAQQLEELAERQEQEAQQNESENPEPGEQQRQDELSNETQQQLNQTESQGQSAQDPQQQSAAQEASDALEEARQAQERAERRLENNDAEGAARAQREAAEKIREAAEKLREASGDDQQQGEDQASDENQQQQGEDQQQGGEQQEQQNAESQMAEDLLDREAMQRRRRQQLREALLGRPTPVDKDW